MKTSLIEVVIKTASLGTEIHAYLDEGECLDNFFCVWAKKGEGYAKYLFHKDVVEYMWFPQILSLEELLNG